MQKQFGRIVVKPIDGSGSVETYIIDEMRQVTDVDYKVKQSRRKFEVEEFVDGVMYHCDIILQNDKMRLFSPSRYLIPTTDYSTSFYSSSVIESDKKRITLLKRFCSQVLKALSAIDGVYHLECFYTDTEEVIFCEIASRIPGAGVRPAIEVAFGVYLTHALLSISNGDAINQIIPRKKNIGQIILFNFSDWNLLRSRFTDCTDEFIEYKQLLADSTTLTRPARSSSDSAAKFVVSGNSEMELMRNIRFILNRFGIDTEDIYRRT